MAEKFTVTKLEGTKYGYSISPEATSNDIFMEFVLKGKVSSNRFTLIMNAATRKLLDENDQKANGSGGGDTKPPTFSTTINNSCSNNTIYLGKKL